MADDEYTKILRKITNKLSADWERDRVFLNRMGEEYVHHPQGKEILRAIGRLMYTRMPEEYREEVGRRLLVSVLFSLKTVLTPIISLISAVEMMIPQSGRSHSI